MRKIKIFILAIMLIPILFLQSTVKADIPITTTKYLNWGVEYWDLGSKDFTIQIDETNLVKIKKITGYVTACPQPNFKLHDTVVRQSLITIINYSNDTKYSVVAPDIGTPKANHSLDRHMGGANVKQVNGQTVDMAINYEYSEPIELQYNKLQMHIVNESYRYSAEKGCFVSTDVNDAVDVEVHFIVEYIVTQ